ncbi:MAG: molecular chaperone DnaJ [Mycoplasmataceae bacterium]|nr:molecular chaperone DnaJ [Mycoplasmataceae bacterium]
MDKQKKDYYEVLGISRDATSSEIKKAYRNLAMKYHPDRDKSEGAEERFRVINEAYEILSDENAKAKYDRYGFDGVNGSMNGGHPESGFGGFGGFGSFEEIFAQFSQDFSGLRGFKRATAAMPRKGASIHSKVGITFRESMTGVKKTKKIKKSVTCDVCAGKGYEKESDRATCQTCRGNGVQTVKLKTPFGVVQTQQTCGKCLGSGMIIIKPCSTCSGKGSTNVSKDVSFNIPSGISSGQVVRINGEGSKGFNGGPNGDLLVEVNVAKSEFFYREGNDLYLDINLSFSELMVGTSFNLELPNENVPIKIPPSTKPGSKFRSKGKGFNIIGTNSRGDLYIKINANMPKKVSEKERSFFKKNATTNAEKTIKEINKINKSIK